MEIVTLFFLLTLLGVCHVKVNFVCPLTFSEDLCNENNSLLLD